MSMVINPSRFGSTVSPLFTPLVIPASFVYADTGVSASISEDDNAGFISQLDDLSESGRHFVQGDTDEQPETGVEDMGGVNALSCDGTYDGHLESNITGLGDTFTVTVFGGASAGDSTASGLFQLRGAGRIHILSGLTGVTRTYQGASIGTDMQFSETVTSGEENNYTIELDSAAGTAKYYMDDILLHTSTGYTGGLAATVFRLMAVNNYENVTGNATTGIIYPYVNDDIRQRVAGWGAHKFGLEGQLDSGHPYKAAPPTTDGMYEPDAIFLSEPPTGIVYSRSKGLTTGQVPVGYTYVGTTPTTVQARVMSGETEIVTWTTIDASPSGGGGSGFITAPQGDAAAYTLEVRRSEDTDLESIGANEFYVGIWVDIYGQSNGRGITYGGPFGGTMDDGTVIYDTGSGYYQVIAGGVIGLSDRAKLLTSQAFGSCNGAIDATGISFLSGENGNTDGIDAMRDLMEAASSDAEYLLWDQGHGDTILPTPRADYIDDLDILHGHLATKRGRTKAEYPLILCSMGGLTDYADDNTTFMQETLVQAAATLTNVHISHSTIPFGRAAPDNEHFSGEGYFDSGEAFAQTVAFLDGTASAKPAWFITAATKVNDTTMDVTLTHSMGTDFTPTTGISGFQVSEDDFTTPVTPSAAVRQDATTIRLTFATLTGTLKVRYQYGSEPDVTAYVQDNGALNSPLYFLNEMTAT